MNVKYRIRVASIYLMLPMIIPMMFTTPIISA